MSRSSNNRSYSPPSPHPVPRTFQWTGPIMSFPSRTILEPKPVPSHSKEPVTIQNQQSSLFSSIQQGFGWGVGTLFARSLFETPQNQQPLNQEDLYKEYKQCIQNGNFHNSCKHLITDNTYKQCVVSNKNEKECLPTSLQHYT